MPSRPFNMRLDDDRRQRWGERARQQGQPLATWLRDIADQAERSDADPAEIRGEIAALRRELNALGNNVNQLAYQANAQGEIPAVDELERIDRKIGDIRRELTRALHR